MKNFFTIILFLLSTILLAQEADRFTQNNNPNDRPRDARNDQFNYVPNEVLVKFKDHVEVGADPQLKSAGVAGVDQVLGSYGIESLQKLFPSETKLKSKKVVKDPLGRDMEIPSLHNIYKLEFPPLKSTGGMPADIQKIIEELEAQPEVEYAEPNYIFSIDELQPVGPELTTADLELMQKNNNLKNATAAVMPNDPLYTEQWYIPAIKADLVWEQTTGDSSQIIAILDTGVDTEHPDLKNKIWRNPDEIPGNGMDDDGNGFVDDVMGWDYINHDNNPMDDNSHGTHVAGIAAAESNNGIGIAGVNWKAKIMPVKVFQSSGRGDASTISQGIIYTMNKGASVINMSFGSYAHSMTLENVLVNAYATAVLVAAAGNNGGDIETCFPIVGPYFPAALSYVLGVQSPDGGFSNTDCNGPTFSNFHELFNYEMKAPGTNVISTIPGGNYRVYQGTSMATPAVAAAISLYRKLIPSEEETNEFMWVKLIQATDTYLDIASALTFEPKPEVWFLNKIMVDDCATCDVDGRVDSGETIKLWFRARNTGGQVDSVYWKIQLGEFEDPFTCNIIKDQSYLGSISPYATCTSEDDPMVIEISPDVAHDRDITFDLLSWYKGTKDTLIQKIFLTPENGIELSGIILSDSILSADKKWLINNSLRIADSITVTLMPGAFLEVNKEVDNRGLFKAIGKSDSLINLKGSINGNAVYKYCDIELGEESLIVNNHNIENCFITNGSYVGSYGGQIKNCYLNFLNGQYGFGGPFFDCYLKNTASYRHNGDEYYRCILDEYRFASGPPNSKYTVFYNIQALTNPAILILLNEDYIQDYFVRNSFVYSDTATFVCKTGSSYDVNYLPNQYWGTLNKEIIKTKYIDFWDISQNAILDIDPILSQPSDSCHAHVWKVLVNGKDAQDEIVEPVGVDKQRFDVYFNRPMDTTFIPQVRFGVRYPYNQKAVNEDGSWSDDSLIYTTYKTIKLTTGDGINRIRVAGAKEADGWGWEIPVEDQRFEFIIAATTSASLEFQASPGLGKVALEWNHNDLEDGLGYNMYRMEHVNDSVLTQPVLINNSLITDTLFTDFSVVPNEKYYYYYKILRTNFAETDSSRVVSATPFTASKGDANGDLSVNVLDITSIVAHMLNNNPQPFIYEAADVNSDATINVLDIVGTVNIIMNDGAKSGFVQGNSTVELYVENDTLFANSSIDLSGLQFSFNGVNSLDDIKILEALKGFEQGQVNNENEFMVFFYSMAGNSIAAGDRIPLIKLKEGSGIADVVLGDAEGNELPVEIRSLTSVWNLRDNLGDGVAELGHNYPNPFNDYTIIPFTINEPVDEAVIRIINLQGTEVYRESIKHPKPGQHQIEWQGSVRKGLYAYLLEISRGNKRVISGMNKMIAK